MTNKSPQTLFDKIWNQHLVKSIENGPDVLYIDTHFIHEVTSPQAFAGLEKRGTNVFRPQQIVATADHNVPTINQHLPIDDLLSRKQVATLEENCAKHGIELWGLEHDKQGIVHIIGPEKGITQPGKTIVCGDSHTATHGALGAIAFGIGTSEVEMVLASQCIMQAKPKKMRINIEGSLREGVTAKDIILYIISQISTSGGTGHFVEYAGSAIRSLSMEGRMTICNMSIEMGARGGMVAPDEVTFKYLKGREYAPKGAEFEKALNHWKTLHTDEGAKFDTEYTFQAENISPMITYGTNPSMGIPIDKAIPELTNVAQKEQKGFLKSLQYMGFQAGEPLLGKKVDYVFLGSCTNGRMEDLRAFANLVKGKQKAQHINAYIVPGSQEVRKQAVAEGIEQILKEAGFELRQPGCSSCLGMNEDKIPSGAYCISTSNRNFEGRQGPGARTLLASPIVVAAAAISGKITDPRTLK